MKDQKIIRLVDTTVNLKEADELLTLSHSVFQEKLSHLETNIKQTKSDKEKAQIYEEANQLYGNYKKTVNEIERCIKFISLMKHSTHEQRTT